MEETKLFKAGVDGGGFTVYRDEAGKVFETGSSGGMMLDEEEDPVKKWKKEFDSWDEWWTNFKKEHGQSWVGFSPLFIHQEIEDSIVADLIKLYHRDNDKYEDSVKKWFSEMNKPFELKPIYKKVKEVAQVISGLHVDRESWSEEGLLYISPANISSRQELILKKARFVIDTPEHRRAMLQQGDIVLVGVGNMDRITDYFIYNLPFKAVAGNGIFIIRPNDDYSFRRWETKRYLLRGNLKGGGRMPRLLRADIENLEL